MNNSYPYPVLGHENDISDGEFSLSLSKGPIVGNDLTEMELQLNLTNPTIKSLVEANKAKYVVEISCKQTYFKHIEKSNQKVFQIALQSEHLRGRVNVRGWIIVTDLIDNFFPEGMHPDYGTNTFSISPGDVLAEDPGFWFIADKDFDALKSPAASFIVVHKGHEKIAPMFVDWGAQGQNKIIITLCKEDYELYKELRRSDAKNIVYSSIVLPVVLQGIISIQQEEKGEESDYFNPKLYAALKAKIDSGLIKNYQTEQPINIAQQLLQNPLNRSLSGVYSAITEPEGVDVYEE